MLNNAKSLSLMLRAGSSISDNDGSAVTPRSDLYFVGASYPVTPLWALDAAAFRYDLKNSANDATMFVVRR